MPIIDKHILGVDIGGTKTAIIYAQEKNGMEIKNKISFQTVKVWDTIDKIIESLQEIIKRNNLSVNDISGIGVSCGGPLDSGKGIIMSPPNLPDWDNIHIVDIIQEHFNVPCAIQNDANACALAEWKFGAGIGAKNMIFITFGTGLGAGLILNGTLYTGANDNAGEIGHIRLSDFGPVGYGKQGSFEGFASGGGIAQLAKTRLEEYFQRGKKVEWCDIDTLDNVTACLIAEQAHKGDELANEIIELSARYLGKGLAILIDILNPDRIVIGSVYARNVDLFYPTVKKVLQKEALDLAFNACKISPAQLGEQIGDYAAVSIASNL